MSILRSKAELCSRKMLEASVALTQQLSTIQQAKIKQVYPDDSDKLISEAYVPLEIDIHISTRCKLYEAKEQIEFILEKCKNDKGF